MRVLVDTNVLISFLLNPSEAGAIRAIVRALVEDKFTLLLPEWLVNELMVTARTKPRLAARIPAERLDKFITLLREVAEPVAAIETLIPTVTRDPDDDYVLAYALVGRADFLVSGDKDLLALRGLIAGLEIVTPAEFVDRLQTRI